MIEEGAELRFVTKTTNNGKTFRKKRLIHSKHLNLIMEKYHNKKKDHYENDFDIKKTNNPRLK